MLIEDVEAFKCWLAKLLDPICDADPSALANYVVALVKKDKTDEDLRIFCADQLDVFLQKETNGFIDKLFEGLYSKDYLSVPVLKPDIKPIEEEKKEIQEELTANRLQCAPPCGLEPFEEERDGRRKKLPSPQRNRSDSNDRSNEVSRRIPDASEYHLRCSPLEKSVLPNEDKSNIGVSRRDVLEDLRERPDAYNRISSERPREKKREDGKWREHDRYYERNEPYRDKFDWRRGKSKSPIKNRLLNRSRSPARGRNREQDSNRNRGEHRERSKFEPERNELEIPYTPVSMTASKPTDQYSCSVQTITNSVTVLAPAHHSENTKESWSNYYNNHSAGNSFVRTTQLPKRRCRDYEEMGLCIRGDLCEFDHGNDPLVVDDVSLPSMIPFPPPPGLPPPGMLLPPLPAPPNMRMPVPQPHNQGPPPGVPPIPRMPITQSSMINNREPPRTAVPSLAPVGPRLPPPIPPSLLYTVSEMSCNYPLPPGMPPFPRIRGPMLPPLSKNTDDTYEPDGYNPEAPSISVSGRSQFRQFYTRSQRSNLIGLTSVDMEPNPRAANIVIQTDSPPTVSTENNSNRVVVEPDRKRPMSSLEGPPVKKSWIDKQGTNNQNKPMFNKKIQFTNTKLEVRKVPPELNNITKLNEHFSKFGTIVNIQVAFKGDPECALIQYLANEEAKRAISSTEAVLNNRFIKLIWHRENDQQHPLHQTYQQSKQHHSQPSHYNQQMQRAHTPPAAVNISTPVPKPQGSGSYVLNNITTKPNLGQASGNQTDTAHLVSNRLTSTGEDCQTFSSTNHAKTVYSSINMKTPSKQLTGAKALDAQEALKMKQEALKLQHDMKKKKQEMLEKQIECQKMLISKLEKNKTMKVEERGEIMKTLKELGVKISQLKDELKNSSAPSTPSKPKSKTEAQKELLDTEMDFYKRVTSGEDATELRKKLNQLQVEAARLGLLSTGRGKTMPPQSRGRGRGRGARGRGSLNNMVVDHRPKSLAVSGFIQEEKEDLLQHFAHFGSIEDLKEEDSPLSVILMFKTRSEAENAANQGSRFRGRRLQVSWHKPRTPSICTDVEEDDPRDEESETTELILNEDDDEDEDEDESRSWRR